jgi:zinc resistance-associated protein
MIRYFAPSLAALAICAFGVTAMAAPGGPSEPPGMERMQHWASDHEALLDARLAGIKAGLKLTPDQEKLWTPFEAAVRDVAKMRAERMKAMMDRVQEMRHMMEQMQDTNDMQDMGPIGPTVSPVDRLEAIAQRMSERSAAIKKVADAAAPLYASLDETQKRLFGLLGGERLMMGHRHLGMGMMGGMGMGMVGRGRGDVGESGMGMVGCGDGEDMGEAGMGMMRRGREDMGEGGMGMMRRGREDLGEGGTDMMRRAREDMGEGGMRTMGRGPDRMNMMGNQSNDDEDYSDE